MPKQELQLNHLNNFQSPSLYFKRRTIEDTFAYCLQSSQHSPTSEHHRKRLKELPSSGFQDRESL